jgi:hypothetical protein
MPMSQNNRSKWERERYSEEILNLSDRIRELESEGKDLPKDLYNEIKKLDDYQLNFILDVLDGDIMIDFIKMYMEENPVSMDLLASFFRYYWFNEFSYRSLMISSKFHKKYGYSVKLFYVLNQKVDISYRDLEDLSGIGKDTINRYVNYYKDWLELDDKIRDLKRKLSDLERKRFKISEKF